MSMFCLIKKFKEWKNRKPKSVRLAEAVFEMLPDEEWKRMKLDDEPDMEDVRDWVLELAWEKKCIYTMEKSLDIARKDIEVIRKFDGTSARLDVYEMFLRRLFKNPGNHRTFASYFK